MIIINRRCPSLSKIIYHDVYVAIMQIFYNIVHDSCNLFPSSPIDSTDLERRYLFPRLFLAIIWP